MKAFPYAVQLAKGRLRCALPDGIRHLAGRGGVALPCKPRPAKQASPEAAPRITVASLSRPLEAGVLMQPPCGGECRHRALRGCVDTQPHPSRKVHRGQDQEGALSAHARHCSKGCKAAQEMVPLSP
jgi:hypothetical protein